VDLVAHTRLKTPTAVAEFILEGVANFADHIQQLEQETLALVETQMEEKRDYLEELARVLSSLVRNQLSNKRSDLIQLTWKFQQEIKLSLHEKRHLLDRKVQRLEHLSGHFFFVRNQKVLHAAKALTDSVFRGMVVKRQRLVDYLVKYRRLSDKQLAVERHRLEMAGQKATMSDPENILKKGFSITTFQGRRIEDPLFLKRGDTIKTYMAQGSMLSEVVEINQKDKNDN
jgi:exodeoxyribonuclease VII large subunit